LLPAVTDMPIPIEEEPIGIVVPVVVLLPVVVVFPVVVVLTVAVPF